MIPAVAGSTPVEPAAVATADARWLANWIADTRDNGDFGFVVVDKRAAQLHVFDANALTLPPKNVLHS
jgi:hypothetical protein